MKTPELLAPVGSKDALTAAIGNGADAVYFGGQAFSARHDAALEDLKWAIDYAHLQGVKAYVTVNTIVQDSELEKICEYLQFLCNAGTDAVIVQDIGIIGLLQKQLPELRVHASTQMTIHNSEGVKFLQELGVKRVVLARELHLDEVTRIKSETGIEVETFIHGAMCFSYSGQCLLSSMLLGRSGNRGHCAQPCRRSYRLNEASGHLLSPRDLNMSEHIKDLIEAGIDSFKIEGRLKRPEYVAGVVRTYRGLIERCLENPADFHVSDDEKHTLRQLFNRGFTTGYFFGNPGNNLMSRRRAHNQGTYLGKVAEYDRKGNFAYIYVEKPLRIGDGIGTEGRDTGFAVRNMYIDGIGVERTPTSSIVKIPVEKHLYKNETVFKTYDYKLMESLLTRENMKKIPLTMSFTAKPGTPVKLCITEGKNRITVTGDKPDKARGSPASDTSIRHQLKKLGNSMFEVKEIKIDLDHDVFIPISQLNALRRDAVKKLEEACTAKWRRQCKKPEILADRKNTETKTLLAVNTCTPETFEAAVDNGADVVYFGGENFGTHSPTKEDYQYAIEYGQEKGAEVYLAVPRIVKNLKKLEVNTKADGYLVANPGSLYHLHNSTDKKPLIIDYPFNVFNKLAMSNLLKYSKRVTLSPELTLGEITHMTPYGQTECIAHGFFPLITSEHDLLGALFPDDNIQEAMLKDNKGFNFPIRRDPEKRTYIMNSQELCMLEHTPDIMKAGVTCLRIEAKMYGKKTTGKITHAYRKAMDNKTRDKCRNNNTTGHYFRDVL